MGKTIIVARACIGAARVTATSANSLVAHSRGSMGRRHSRPREAHRTLSSSSRMAAAAAGSVQHPLGVIGCAVLQVLDLPRAMGSSGRVMDIASCVGVQGGRTVDSRSEAWLRLRTIGLHTRATSGWGTVVGGPSDRREADMAGDGGREE